MTSEDILQRAKGIVEGDWVEDTFEVSFLSIFNELHHLAQKSALGPKELEQWTQMGIDLMMRGISTLDKNLGVYTFEFFPAFHTLTSYPIDIEKPWVINSIMSTSVDSVWLEKFSVSLDFYHKFFERIKHPKEKPLYFDYGTICIGKGFNRMRSGGVIVTNQRLLSIGAELNKTTEVKHRYDIFYPDIQEKAYYGVLDYVDLKNIISFENIYGRL
ncbi:MAG: hypothetical protein ACXAEN_26690, partial [Candidatus Thorarchaeota archaeon]